MGIAERSNPAHADIEAGGARPLELESHGAGHPHNITARPPTLLQPALEALERGAGQGLAEIALALRGFLPVARRSPTNYALVIGLVCRAGRPVGRPGRRAAAYAHLA